MSYSAYLISPIGDGKFKAWSAGSYPKGTVHPAAIRLLHSLGYPIDGLRSKSWEEFEGEGASVFDFIVTDCDNATGEVCRIWRGKPMRSHWGIADPSAPAARQSHPNLRQPAVR